MGTLTLGAKTLDRPKTHRPQDSAPSGGRANLKSHIPTSQCYQSGELTGVTPVLLFLTRPNIRACEISRNNNYRMKVSSNKFSITLNTPYNQEYRIEPHITLCNTPISVTNTTKIL